MYIYIYIYLHNICIYEIHKHDIHNKNIYGGGDAAGLQRMLSRAGS